MNRFFPRIAIGLLAFSVGVYAHSECNRLADYFGANVEAVSAIPTQVVHPVTEQSCDKITTAWHAATLTRNIPSAVQIRCWGVDEGKAHPLAQILAHSPGH